jgi:signal transduction histidine kinase
VRKVNSVIQGLIEDAENRLWFVSSNELHVLQNDLHQQYPQPEGTEQSFQNPSGLFALKDGRLVLDAGNRLLPFQPASGLFSAVLPYADGRRRTVLGLLKDKSLCVLSSDPGGDPPDERLETYDGIKFQPFPSPAPDLTLVGHPSVFFAAQNGDFWLSGEQGIIWYHDRKWRVFPSSENTLPGIAVAFAELADGKIWCAVPDRIWEFDGRNWATARTGFDHINALLRTQDGSVWIASNGGLHRFFQGAWVENGVAEGLPSADVRKIYEDQHGRIWAGTAHGLALYHPEADPDPPQTSIQKLTGKESNIPEGGTINLSFSAQDKWKYNPTERLLYAYRLDERDWSPFREVNHVSFNDLPVGKHYFQVRSMDRNCNVEPRPARLEFIVTVPWYRETRLVLILCTALCVAIFFAGLAFNRHRRLLRSYAEVERKIAERTRELEIANRELVQSQKMNALGTLAAGIAHDFNNILSIIKGSAQIIEDNLDNPPKVSTRVDRIKTVVEQGAGIIKAMLGFSRSSGEQPGRCDVNTVVDDTIKLLGDRFLRDVEVGFERTPNLPEILLSKDFVQQILLNFIFNASESMAKRKQVILATRRIDKLPANVVLMPVEAAAYVCVSVRDFGCGIPPENMARIFEPFFTTKALSVRRGTGLGLSMVSELAKKMEAGLAVESVVDQGSTFTLILPVRDLPTDAKS